MPAPASLSIAAVADQVGGVELPDPVALAPRLTDALAGVVDPRRRRGVRHGLVADVTTAEMTHPDTGPGGLYARLEEAGHTLTRFEESVRVALATPEEAATLSTTPGAPLLRLVRIASTPDRVVEINEITMLGERYELYYDLPAL